MDKVWSKSWKGSKQPRKQRKYAYNLPMHLARKLLSSILSKDLRQKYGKRNIPLRVGDKVKIMVGQFKGKTGKVETVLLSSARVYVEGINMVKKDGSKVNYPLHASNLMLVEPNLDDQKRKKMLERK